MDNEFIAIKTEDGSPSLKYLKTGEPMHNLKGAFSESLYIYLEALKACKEMTSDIKLLSVGLGIAYNELIAIAYWLDSNKSFDLSIESYEIEAYLTESFLKWVKKQESPLHTTYQDIEELCKDHFQLDMSLQDEVAKLFEQSLFTLKPDILKFTPQEKANCLFFDAFSSNTSPELWDEDWLSSFIENNCSDTCVFTTYAAKGSLNRALKKNGFSISKKEGFRGKRQSTFATRS